MKEIIEHYYLKKFNAKPSISVKAPGRINILGEHIDYNNGLVLPSAIDKAIYLGLGKREDLKVVLYSIDYDEVYEIENIHHFSPEKGHWSAHILGVIKEIQSRGYTLETGLNICFGGDIPVGAGLSSSAAVEVGTGLGVSELFKLELDKKDLCLIAQATEHKYIGVNCGIMDMYASVFSKIGQVLALDCNQINHTYISTDFSDHKFILVDTGVKHSLASSEYNLRRTSCEQGIRYFKTTCNLDSFKDLSEEVLQKHSENLSPEVYEKCLYVVQEIARVKEAAHALSNTDFEGLGKLMFKTHSGLSNLFQVSSPELDFLVEKAKTIPGVLGARMHGGGFGGCTINLIKKEFESDIIRSFESSYLAEYGKKPTVISVEISNGASLI